MEAKGAWRFRRRVNLLGQKFGLLTVVAESRTSLGEASWECLCECGNTSIARTWRLRKGKTKSCGCQQTVAAVAWTRAGGRKTHGCRHTRAYKAWSSMKERCLHPWHKSYKHYGAQGVTICQRWLDSFEAFLEDMGHPPRKWVWEIETEAKKLGVSFYEKSNLHGRIRGYPGQPVYAEPDEAPEPLRYLPTDKG